MDHMHQLSLASASPAIIVAVIFGFLGSIGHCAAMCGAVQVLLSRRGLTQSWRLPLLHTGRIITYTGLGILAGAAGGAFTSLLPDIGIIQGILAIILAAMAIYFAVALLGKAPSPELLLVGVTRRWGRAMQKKPASFEPDFPEVFAMGLLWGLLPCGFVLAALIPAASTGNPFTGAMTMLGFGLGTWPILVLVNWLAGRDIRLNAAWVRPLAAIVVLLFGIQMALRGLAAWGMVDHLMIAEQVMLW